MWTAKQIHAFPTREKRYRVADDLGQKGSGKLILDIQPLGMKTFFYQYYNTHFSPSKRELIKIGLFKESAKSMGITLSQAREKALNFATICTQYGDVKAYLAEQTRQAQVKKRTTDITLQAVLDHYLVHKDLKPRTIDDYQRTMQETFSAYLHQPLSRINRHVILQLYQSRCQVSIARANNAMRVFKALYNYQRAISRSHDGHHVLPENPADILHETKVIKKVPRRKTYLAKEQLKQWFEAVNSLDSQAYHSGGVVRDYLLFLLFTGTRRAEALHLRREDIDLGRKVFILRDTKNREVVELPMSDYLSQMVNARLSAHQSDYLFASSDPNKPLVSLKRPLQYLRQQKGLCFTPHDLRRTFITIAESLDISAYTIKKLVNHKINESGDVTAGYMVIDLERMRAASEKITQYILRHLS